MHISGIQQVGIGVKNVSDAWSWYRKYFGVTVKLFDEKAVAGLMLPYTGNQPQERHAILALNMQGGGGFEIWQYTKREPRKADFNLLLGDLGIFSVKIKTFRISESYNKFKQDNQLLRSELIKDPINKDFHYYVEDSYKNIFELVDRPSLFMLTKMATGGVYGANIGVSDMNKSLKFYSKILGYNKIVYDIVGNFDDLKGLPGGEHSFRRVLLQHERPRIGFFSRFFGPSEIELFQVLDRKPNTIYENRFWGDLGFIHLCFDVYGMNELKKLCEDENCPFTVDSASSFKMENAAGHFAYIEDPDHTLIEFVETHKVPILKKFGWYLNLKKRNPEIPLPDWMLKALKYNAKKD